MQMEACQAPGRKEQRQDRPQGPVPPHRREVHSAAVDAGAPVAPAEPPVVSEARQQHAVVERVGCLQVRNDLPGHDGCTGVAGYSRTSRTPSIPFSRWLAKKRNFLLQYIGYVPALVGVKAIVLASVSSLTRTYSRLGALTTMPGPSPPPADLQFDRDVDL
jgi:hypothetical protein